MIRTSIHKKGDLQLSTQQIIGLILAILLILGASLMFVALLRFATTDDPETKAAYNQILEGYKIVKKDPASISGCILRFSIGDPQMVITFSNGAAYTHFQNPGCGNLATKSDQCTSAQCICLCDKFQSCDAAVCTILDDALEFNLGECRTDFPPQEYQLTKTNGAFEIAPKSQDSTLPDCSVLSMQLQNSP